MVTTEQLNEMNHAVRDDGELIGHVLRRALGADPGWYFIAAHKRLTNRWPDSMVSAPTWQEALPG